MVLESLALQGGSASPYTLFVNGRPGKAFGPQRLLGGDSLLLLLEVTLPPTAEPTPYLAADALLVVNKGLQQEVPIMGWGQNARSISSSTLPCATYWDAALPYIIERSILVDTLCTLTIGPGTRLYFKPGAFLYVKGTLLAEGEAAENERILFRNHRQGGAYDTQPGQWGGILFLEGSKANRLRYCDIRNAQVGVRLGTPDPDDTPDLVLESCRLENHLEAGILAYTSDLLAINTLVANCLGPAVANLAGGNYRYQHCTFANLRGGQRSLPAALFSDNVVLDNGEMLTAPLQLQLQNTIIWGNLGSGNEFLADRAGQAPFSLLLEHNLIRSSDTSLEQGGNLISTALTYVRFQDISRYNYRPDSLSPAVNAGKDLGILLDLSGQERDAQPDIGALEYTKE
ncbi:hypothetical protein [Cesiribacter andamanensis]|uniref:Right handed beta helix domain-containing protein n=1 Tax=Cesiribacter andamanensis AMV16 TaxID=1279009 RepID=M7NWU3_9BACT|nr:hypothetical protein [Cesiribacter andamanensis]EMR02924.1 hypothetical protein ADICEAN_01962 [Cesiribacter andamanensis AMV16]